MPNEANSPACSLWAFEFVTSDPTLLCFPPPNPQIMYVDDVLRSPSVLSKPSGGPGSAAQLKAISGCAMGSYQRRIALFLLVNKKES